MGRRSRHSAKTGDQSLYKNRNNNNTSNNQDDDNSDNDPMYDEVDRYNNKLQEEENYLQLDVSDKGSSSEEEDDGITTKREGVFDLGMDDDEGDSSSDDNDSEEEGGVDNRQIKQKDIEQASSSSDSSDNSDSSEDDDQEEDKTSKLFNWGKTKSSYYHGDTADLEIGQSVNDAYLEEEAGREVEKARLDDLDEMDFMLDGDDDDDDGGDGDTEDEVEKVSSKKRKSKSTNETTTLITKKKQTPSSKLSTKDKLKVLKSQHPELLPLIQHFNNPINELNETTLLACGALLKGGVRKGKKEAEVCSFVFIKYSVVSMFLLGCCSTGFGIVRT